MVSRFVLRLLAGGLLMLLPLAASASFTVPDIDATTSENTPTTINIFSGLASSTDTSQFSYSFYLAPDGSAPFNYFSAYHGAVSVPGFGDGNIGYTPPLGFESNGSGGYDAFWYQLIDESQVPNVSSNIAEVRIIVTPPFPSCTLTATPSLIAPSATSTLSWTTSNTTGVSIDQGVVVPFTGSSTVVSATTTTTYTMTATSTAGTSTCATTLNMLDVTPPVITLLGDNPLTLTVGDMFTDPGFTATDDTGVVASTTDDSSVDTTTPGSYVVTYTASDAAGNTATSTRMVNLILAPVPPVASDSSASSGPERESHSFSGSTVVHFATTMPDSGQVLGASVYNFTRQLGRGSSGDDVLALQQFLTSEGFFSTQATGYFGALTHAAVLAYQKSRGVVGANGHVGPATLALLNEGSLPTVAVENLQLQLASALSALQALTALVGK